MKIVGKLAKLLFFIINLMNSELIFDDIDVINKFHDDAELFINNDKPVRKHFKVALSYLTSEYKMFFEHVDKKKRTGIKLKLSNDENDNELVKDRALNILYDYYVPYLKKEMKD